MIFNAKAPLQLLPAGSRQVALTKMLRVMKLTAFLLFIACLHVSAHGIAQDRVTFSGKEVSLEKVFSVIKKQTGYTFFYYKELIDHAKKVTLNVKNASITDVLTICLKDQALEYSIEGKTIFIVNKQNEKPVLKETPGFSGDIKGRVLNGRGEPLAGANIVVKRTGKGTITDVNGNFSLSNLASDDIIIITFVGYQPQSVKVDNMNNLTLTMVLATSELDEMIIQAYGTTTRRLATGNIAKVSATEIERQPVINPLLALQGKVAGLDINQTSGFASAPIKVELRGRNSITGFPSDPLYIVDGVPLTIADVGGQSNYGKGSFGFLQSGFGGPANGQSPLFNINPADIESIEVLKDADATAIYGSRGSNGVILITTKKGHSGKTKFDLHIQEGITQVTRFWKMLNTPQYIQMRHEALSNDGLPVGVGDYDINGSWDTTRYTDWQKAIWGRTGKTIDAQGALSGGDEHTTFRIGAGYNHTTNILTVNGADQRASVSTNLIHHSRNQRLTVSVNSLYTFTQSDMVDLPGNVNYAPNAPSIYDSLGKLNWSGWGGNSNNSIARGAYPFSNLAMPYTSKTNFLNSNLNIGYELIKGLSVKASMGYNSAQTNQQQFTPISSKDPMTNPTGSAVWAYNFNKSWIIEPQINYGSVISKGKLDLLIGATVQHTQTDGLLLAGNNYSNDNLIHDITAAPSLTSHDNYGEYRYGALFGRVGYNWENKYMINVTSRRDGSSRFGPGKQYGNFGSIAAAWIFTEEPWVKKGIKFLSFGKLRASYGTTGSDAVGDYKYLSRYSSNGTFLYNNVTVLAPIQAPNPDYQWQVNKKLEAAINLGFIQNRVNIQVVYYRDRCGNQLVGFPLASFTGFSTTTANSPALVQNEGWEFGSSVKVISNKKFSWDINFNTAINRNKLVSYPNFDQSPYVNQYVVGQPLNILKLLHFTGVDPQTGRYTYYDENHNNQVDIDYSGKTTDDRLIYNLNPKFFGGIGMNLTYKSFQLSMFFNFKKQIGLNALLGTGYPGSLNLNQPTAVLKRWQKPGDFSNIARYTTNPVSSDVYFTGSDGVWTDASYIRLSNLSISYDIPVNYLKRIGMQNCSLFVHANNLFVITKYKGIDPETQNFGGMPPSKIIVGGINFNF